MASRKETSSDHQRTEYGDQRIERGAGGEIHQVAAGDAPRLTTQQGTVVSDDQNTLRAGERGPDVLEDFHFREKIFHFDHERIPERVVHARGYGAHGYFENYEPLTGITRADPFSKAGLRTPVFVRFSTVAGNKGSTDLARDVRGFATKFYTREGDWDLVGNNIPVFFIQDAIKFPDVIHAAKQEPDRGFPQAQTAHDNFWDFVSLLPESAHMLMWIMSDRAIPRSFRFMEGFGVHTFRLVNAEGRSTFVKFHWKPKLGMQSVIWNEALKISGADPDFHRRDLWDAITAGDFPEWELGLQLFDDDFADRFAFDVLDPTKIIPEEEVPVRRVGRLVLDQVVDNFYFSYLDTQLKRLGGPNFTQLPVNAPKCPVAHFQQDGHMAMVNPQGRVNYEPNSWDPPGPREDPDAGFRTYPDGQGDQAGPKRRLRPESLAGPVAEGLGLPRLPDPLPAAREPVRDLSASPALSILANGPDSFAGRKIGILVTDGVDAAKLEEVKSAAEQVQVNVELIAPAVGGVDDSDGNHAPADQKIDGGPSVLYDAVILLASKHGTPALAAQPAVRDFVADAYAHCKFIGYTGDASPLFEAAGLGNLTDDGFVSLDEHSAADFISRCAKLRFWPRQASIAQRAGVAKASAGQG